jgi:hypothetical protein
METYIKSKKEELEKEDFSRFNFQKIDNNHMFKKLADKVFKNEIYKHNIEVKKHLNLIPDNTSSKIKEIKEIKNTEVESKKLRFKLNDDNSKTNSANLTTNQLDLNKPNTSTFIKECIKKIDSSSTKQIEIKNLIKKNRYPLNRLEYNEVISRVNRLKNNPIFNQKSNSLSTINLNDQNKELLDSGVLNESNKSSIFTKNDNSIRVQTRMKKINQNKFEEFNHKSQKLFSSFIEKTVENKDSGFDQTAFKRGITLLNSQEFNNIQNKEIQKIKENKVITPKSLNQIHKMFSTNLNNEFYDIGKSKKFILSDAEKERGVNIFMEKHNNGLFNKKSGLTNDDYYKRKVKIEFEDKIFSNVLEALGTLKNNKKVVENLYIESINRSKLKIEEFKNMNRLQANEVVKNKIRVSHMMNKAYENNLVDEYKNKESTSNSYVKNEMIKRENENKQENDEYDNLKANDGSNLVNINSSDRNEVNSGENRKKSEYVEKFEFNRLKDKPYIYGFYYYTNSAMPEGRSQFSLSINDDISTNPMIYIYGGEGSFKTNSLWRLSLSKLILQ